MRSITGRDADARRCAKEAATWILNGDIVSISLAGKSSEEIEHALKDLRDVGLKVGSRNNPLRVTKTSQIRISSVVLLSAAAWFAGSIANCADPVFTTSDPNGGWAESDYYVHNNMWNSSKYHPCTSTLYASSHDNWHVVTRMNNKSGDGAVKTYPNVHRDYRSVPITSFDSITSTFAATSPRVGIYNVAYDLWINGVARPGCTEIMIWTDNFNQVPGGSYVQEVTFGDQTYKVYKRPGSSGYIAFVTTTNFSSGTVNLLEIIRWTIAKSWLPGTSSLNQICFGVEMVSTDDTDATSQVTAFSIDSKPRSKLDPAAPATGATNPPTGGRPARPQQTL